MNRSTPLSPITVLGGDSQGGSYLLRIRVGQELQLAFGRFRKGKLITVPAGEYVYVGSALADSGAASLARRLVRHATRSAQKAPHPIRDQMLDRFATIGLGSGDLRPRRGKTLFWHVDYLLDAEVVDLSHVFIIRAPRRLEDALAQLLEDDACTSILAKGLGANDARGGTHLLRVGADESWWQSLPSRLALWLDDSGDA